MMLWQIDAAIEGWNRAQSPEEAPDPITVEEYDAGLRRAGYA